MRGAAFPLGAGWLRRMLRIPTPLFAGPPSLEKSCPSPTGGGCRFAAGEGCAPPNPPQRGRGNREIRFLGGLILALFALVSCQPAFAGSINLSTGGGSGGDYTALVGTGVDVNPAVCGTVYIATASPVQVFLPSNPPQGAKCHVGIATAVPGGYVTVTPGAGDTYAGNEKVTTSLDVTGYLDLYYVALSTTWFAKTNPHLQVWNSSGSYAAGQLVVDSSSPTKMCMSRAPDNANNALTDTTKWLCIGDGTIGRFNIGGYFKSEDNDGNCSGTGGSALNLDFTTNSHKKFTITANCEITATAPTSTADEVQSVSMCWTQSGAGGFTLALPSNFEWAGDTAPTWATTTTRRNCAFCSYYQGLNHYVCSGVENFTP